MFVAVTYPLLISISFKDKPLYTFIQIDVEGTTVLQVDEMYIQDCFEVKLRDIPRFFGEL